MSDTFTVTTHSSWFTRMKNSVIGALIGLLLIVVMVVLLFWNEGRAVQTARSLAEGAGLVVDVPAGSVDAANEGKLIHVSGDVATTEQPKDDGFGISTPGVRLERHAEMYQWKEQSESRTSDKLGGGQDNTTTYTYSKAWDDSPIDSGDFKQRANHINPPMEITSKEFQVSQATLGAFQLSPRVVSMIPAQKDFAVSPDQTQAIDAAYGGNKRVSVAEGRIYLGADSTTPAIGDYRISYRLAPVGPASVVGKQVATGFDEYQTQAGDALLMVDAGTVSAADMFKEAETINTVITWLLRAVGLLFLCIGFSLTMAPLKAVAMVLPPVGRLIGAGTGLIGTVLGIVVGAGTIALAWFWYRPLLAIGIIAAGIVIAYALGRMGRARAPASAPAA